MDVYKETFETWNKVAALYEEKFMDFNLYDDTYDQFCGLVAKKNSKILEIGCGPGNITKYLLNKCPNYAVDGIDIAPNMIALAKKNNPSANFRVMDIRNIGSLEAVFEGIICGFCLPYLSADDVSKLIKDSSDLLRAKGILYLSFVEGDSAQSGFQKGSGGDRVYFYYHSYNQLEKVLIKNDFKIIKLIDKVYTNNDGSLETHRILLARKLTVE